MKYTCRLQDALKQWNLFVHGTSSYDLVNGLTANEGVNVDKSLPLPRVLIKNEMSDSPDWFKNSYDD